MEDKDFSTPLPELAPGTTHEGFTVTSVEPVAELSGTAYLMRHDATGARLLWLACPDTNKAFSIAFKTPPADDTGTFHILEHSVLCGSDSYPVKEPFVNLLKTSMQTFLNALTYPDKTIYPVASTNTADLENLMGVYLDAVLHPAIYHRPRIFEQEGWHYEMADDGTLVRNGVVLNEMRGALSDPDEVLYLELCRRLFPSTAYGFESGGHPRAIPTLTYEKFLDNHARHYQLSNSYTVLYGDLDIDRELAFVGERFDGAADRHAGAPNPLDLQAPVLAPRATVRMATSPQNATAGIAYVAGTAMERERMLAIEILVDALTGSNEAPLKRRMLDLDLADDFVVTTVGSCLQPHVVFQLKGLHPGGADRFRAELEGACRELADAGIPRDKLSASLAQATFNLREGDFGYADGVAMATQVMSGWLYDDAHALDYVRYEDALAHIRAKLDSGYFERLLLELVCDSSHSAEVELVPTEAGDAAEEAEELATKLAAMGEKDVQHIRDEVAALRAEQEAPDSPEDLDKLPTLGISDIEDPEPAPAAPRVEAPLPCVAHELDTHGIDYVYHYFPLSHVTFDELPYVGVLAELLSKLDTQEHSASDLDTLIEERLGGLSFFTETYTRDDDLSFARPTFVVGASALSENVDALAQIPREVWDRTLFSDTDSMRDILTQARIGMEQSFTNSGHSAAAARAATGISSAAIAADRLGGVDYYLFLKDLLSSWDERAQGLGNKLVDLAGRIFTSDGVTVSFTGPAEDRARFWAQGGDLGLAPAAAEPAGLALPTPTPRREALVIPSNVSFVCRMASPSSLDSGTPGSWQVATRALSFDYLWNEVRVKGGAYGVGFRRDSQGSRTFWSYRDPNVDATFGRYDGAAEWLSRWDPSEDEFAGYVVSTVAAHDAPVKPRALARRQDVASFSGHGPKWRDQVREQELGTTPAQVRAMAAALADDTAPQAVCVFGSASAIAASSVDFEVTHLVDEPAEDPEA